MSETWTLGPEDRDVVLDGQVCLEDLLPAEDRGALVSMTNVLDESDG